MRKLYEKNELAFAIVFIVIYSIGQSFATSANKLIGIDYSANAILNIALTVILVCFIKTNGLSKHFGICAPSAPASRFLFYIPLAIIASGNIWNGVRLNFKPADMFCYITYMICVGIVEEIIFRGLLFKAIAKDSIKTAIVISSLTFGIGHILNLIIGVSSDIVESVSQVIGAVAIGFLFVVIFYREGSILPCIITHSAIDAASAFANMDGLTAQRRILLSGTKFVIVVVYTLFLIKTLPRTSVKAEEENEKQRLGD